MAQLKKRLPGNVSGDFFVDDTCINCDTCRQLAPQTFADDGEYSYVFQQPQNALETQAALRALVACPTSSIGTQGKQKAGEAMKEFPYPLTENIYYCGFTAENSFGGDSYFIQDPRGNWMIDSPRWVPFLVKQFRSLGGIQYIFLTHRDDVAAAKKYAEAFHSEVLIHQRDLKAYPKAQHVLIGEDPIPFQPEKFGQDILIQPTPGHTQGHCVLLYKKHYLFSGDHLWLSRRTGRLGASKGVAWYSWPEQIRSMEKLLDYDFDWVFPGHGRRIHLPQAQMKQQLNDLVEEMRQI